MTEPILIAAAWPYANAEIHVGNLTGSYLPADIFARYNRLRGRDVMMVSGSDSHGTPITVRADKEGVSALDVYKRFHEGFLELFQKLGLTYDIFTSTHTENHSKVAQTMFTALKENGYLYVDRQNQWFSPQQGKFLPDRYVEGTCYICGAEGARSDQCDQCGNMLEPQLLLNPKSKVDGSTPELRATDHYFLDLAKLEPQIVEFLSKREGYWRQNVLRQSLGQMQANHLHGRAITRDLDWGLPIPVEGWDSKRLYVWFEAVIGYLSSSIEYSQIHGTPESWREWWHRQDARSYYFIGKDNIPFHAIIWPGQLIGTGNSFDKLFDGKDAGTDFVLPYDVPANEFMNMEGRKISGSHNWGVWGLDFLSRYDPDPLRYYLTVNMPETRDTDWDWEDFYKRNNDELVATWGNLANRVLAFAFKNWEGVVPDPGELTEKDSELLAAVEAGFESVAKEMEAVHLRAALAEGMRLATEVNRYLDTTAPWTAIKTDRQAAARAVFTALKAIDSIKILLAPFLPFTSQKLHEIYSYEGKLFGEQRVENRTDALGDHNVLLYDGSMAIGRWEPSQLKPGQPLQQPQALFKKLDVKIIEEERARLGKYD